MSAPTGGGGEGAARRAQVLRLETLRDIEALLRGLRELHAELMACEDDDGERVRDLLHAVGVMTGVWLDDIACRFAGTEHDADELFARAWHFVDGLELDPGGFLTRDDPALFTTLRGSAASMLARLWVTGYLLGPVPEDAWPDEELAVLLLRALEHHADVLALTQTLDHHNASRDESRPPQKPETEENPGGTQAESP
ncbi:hypothetical protein OG462_44365 [Streptomyces sp. NBC_01077]|uniref:hypothetical protein n=1 Tax=Streptomyces sp. NBC_01077 TaxID=2903746 RepID=UPI003868E4B6|nr:hypothetical protein OG462_00640 [Streptomyces sp. NBC_01077]WSV43740.1 hypothetical protein OG462_44365 [Streptomyces sp. NBC_01077]